MGLQELFRLGWDRISAVLLALLGVVALVLGYVGVSDSLYTAQQVPYVLSGGIGGIFLLSLAGILWLSADLRDEWSQLDRVELLLARQEQQAAEQATARTPRQPTGTAGSTSSTGSRRIEPAAQADVLDARTAASTTEVDGAVAAPPARTKRTSARKSRSAAGSLP